MIMDQNRVHVSCCHRDLKLNWCTKPRKVLHVPHVRYRHNLSTLPHSIGPFYMLPTACCQLACQPDPSQKRVAIDFFVALTFAFTL